MSERLKEWGYDGPETEGVARVVSAHGDYFHLICSEKLEGEALARTKSVNLLEDVFTLAVMVH